MNKFKTDLERLEAVKEFKLSGKSITEFARLKGIAYSTLRDWIYAFDNVDGGFIKLNKMINAPTGVMVSDEDITMKMLSAEEIMRKSRHFTRFDHSVVVIEYEKLKVTTSLAQALVILEKLDDRF